MGEDAYSRDEFWEKYQQFADESHRRHMRGVLAALSLVGLHRISKSSMLDLGCGRARISESTIGAVFEMLSPAFKWHGMDADPVAAEHEKVSHGDFNDYPTLMRRLIEVRPDIVTSFFATDVVMPRMAAINTYVALLLHTRFVNVVLTTGFYYDQDDLRDKPQVREVDGLVSYQVPRVLADHPDIEERRVTQRAPSTLFGPNVVETYSIYVKKEVKR